MELVRKDVRDVGVDDLVSTQSPFRPPTAYGRRLGQPSESPQESPMATLMVMTMTMTTAIVGGWFSSFICTHSCERDGV